MVFFPERIPTLHNERLTLREMTEADVPAWFERARDAESSALSGDPIPQSIDVCFDWLDTHRALFRKRSGIRWAVVPAGSAGSVGSIGLSNISAESSSADIGAVVARAHHNQGLATAAAGLVVAYAFDQLRLQEIRADLVVTNLASRRVLGKLGFELLRTIHGYRDAGPVRDGYLYVLRAPHRAGR